MRELLAELNRTLEQNRTCVYCSVVETRGSTPQKAGAAMLVFADGGPLEYQILGDADSEEECADIARLLAQVDDPFIIDEITIAHGGRRPIQRAVFVWTRSQSTKEPNGQSR